MTNATIIFNESCRLMEDGKIGTTGRVIEVEMADGSVIKMNEPEPIHTYKKWQELGFQVDKGQKKVADIMIWKSCKGKANDDEDGEETMNMYLRKAFFLQHLKYLR